MESESQTRESAPAAVAKEERKYVDVSHAEELAHPVSHDLMPRRFKDYIVSERELSTLGFMSASGTLLTAFFGVAAGAAISLGITLKTVDVPAGKPYLAFFAGFLVALGFSVLLLAMTIVMAIRAWSDVRKIRTESEQEQRRRELLKEQIS